MRATRVLVFARAPEPGRAKTRLIPALGADGAAHLYGALLDRTLEVVHAAAVGPVELWADAAPVPTSLRARARRWQLPVHLQAQGDLGIRMGEALGVALAAGDAAVLVGSDLGDLGADHLASARDALADGADVVFAPAEDGGYGLVGVAAGHERALLDVLFDAIPWSTAAVMARTRQRLAAAGLRWHETAPVWDVDVPADLGRLRDDPEWSERLERIVAPVRVGGRH